MILISKEFSEFFIDFNKYRFEINKYLNNGADIIDLIIAAK